MTITTTTDADRIAALERQLATSKALEDFWRQKHADAWTLIGRIDYALEIIGNITNTREARRWARQMRGEIKEQSK